MGDGAKIGAGSVVIHDVPAAATVVGNPGHPVRVDGERPSGPDADWAHLPDPVADAIRGLANRVGELEELVADLTGRKPEGAEVTELPNRRGRTPWAASLSRGGGPRPVARHRLVARVLAAVPQPDVEGARRHAQLGGDQLAGVHGAGADLLLLLAGRQQLAGVDVGGQLGLVAQHSVHAAARAGRGCRRRS